MQLTLRRLTQRLGRLHLGPMVVAVLVAGLHWAGFFVPLEQAFGDLRFRLLQRPAGSDVVLVGIDGRSLNELPGWPWSRADHARVVERLIDAGAAIVAIDLNLSAPSAADDALEAVLRTAPGRIVLPVYQQHRVAGSPGEGQVLIRPLKRFAAHAVLAAANLKPDADGLIREYAAVQGIGGTRVRSMAAQLAGRVPPASRFAIDYGIRVETLPQLSYIDVYRGTFDPQQVAGRKVIIGASAAELGDVLSVPVYRGLARPAIHALAYESIVQGRALSPIPLIVVYGGMAGLSFAFGAVFLRTRWRAGLMVAVAGAVALLAGSIAVQALAPVRPEVLPWAATVGLAFVAAQFHRMDALLRRTLRQSTALMHRTALFKSVVEDSFDGILIANQHGRIKLVNRAGLDLLGRSGQGLVGHSLPDVLPQLATAPGISPSKGGASGVRTGRFEITVEPADGPARRLEVSSRISVVPGAFGQASKRSRPARQVFVVVFRDVTAQREAEEARDRAAREALAANRAKSNFLANMSHELRTPLNAVIGFSEIIRDEMIGPIGNPTYADYAEDIHRSGSHLLQIISDILDLSKVEAGITRIADDDVDLVAAARFAVRLVAERAAAGGVEVAMHVGPDVPFLRGDERLLKQIAVNLLSNAVKFTPSGGSVDVRIGLDPDGSLVLSVADTGIGISENDLPEIVKPFRQVEGGLDRRYEGAGLGLALVQSFVGLHQGAFTLDSDPGEGTTATVRFPPARLRRPAAVSTPDRLGDWRPSGHS